MVTALRADEMNESYARFEHFHLRNPEVYETLVHYAREAKAHGRKVGIRAVWERMRWSLEVEHDPGDYKMNDHYTRYYARMIMSRETDLRGFFETRER